jgi:ABC-2 type transport system permease protein
MRLLGMMWKEMVQLRRDPMSLTLALIIPVALLFIFGYAINTDVRNLPTVVLDEARDVESQKLLEAFQNTRYFAVRFQARSLDEVARLIDRGDAKVGIVIPPDFSERLRSRRAAAIQVIVDASDPQVAVSAINAATALGLDRSIEPCAGGDTEVGLDVRIRAQHPDQEPALFIAPAHRAS